jgi:hypothetical protein
MIDNGGGLVQAHKGVRQGRVERLHLNMTLIKKISNVPDQ